GSSNVWSDSRYMLKTDCSSHTFTSEDDTTEWLQGGKDNQWYADRNNKNWPPSMLDGINIQQKPGQVLGYNAIGQIV
ncbi:unnamed protein product, partial [marine sediment metagenome]